MTNIRIGIIGTGHMAATMARTIASTAGAQVEGVASGSGDVERARIFAQVCGGVRAYDTPLELLAHANVDLVYIASATASHASLAIAALDAGKAVLCEKPFATSVTEGQRVVEAARRNGRFFMEALWTPFLPADRRVVELVRTRAVGEPVHLSASFGYPVSVTSHPGLFAPIGGGVLLDRAIYPISLALRILGPVEGVAGRVQRTADGIDVHASLQLAHRSGAQSQLAVSLVALLENTAIISGSLGSITLGAPLIGAEVVAVQRVTPPPAARRSVNVAAEANTLGDKLRAIPALRRLKRMLPSGAREHLPYGASPYGPLLRHVIEALQSKKAESDEVPLALSLEILRIVDAVRADGTPA